MDLVLNFERGNNPKTGEPQWQARSAGKLYVPDRTSLLQPRDGRTAFRVSVLRVLGTSVVSVILLEYIELVAKESEEIIETNAFDSVELDLEFSRGEHKGREQWKSFVKDNATGKSTLYIVDNESGITPSHGGQSWKCRTKYQIYPKGKEFDVNSFRIISVELLEELSPRSGDGIADFVVEMTRTENGGIDGFSKKTKSRRRSSVLATNKGAGTQKGPQGQKQDKNGGYGTSRDALRRQRKRAHRSGK